MFIGFLPKLVLRSALISPSSVLNFRPIRVRIRVLWRILRSVSPSVRNEDEEEESSTERNGIFRGIILRNETEQTHVSPSASTIVLATWWPWASWNG